MAFFETKIFGQTYLFRSKNNFKLLQKVKYNQIQSNSDVKRQAFVLLSKKQQ